MIKKCLSCDFRTDDSSVDACPVCFRTLVASLLESIDSTEPIELTVPTEPDGSAGAPEAAPAGSPMWRYQPYTAGAPPRGPLEALSDNGLGWILLFVLVVAAGWAAKDWLVAGPAGAAGGPESAAGVRVGMHVSDVLQKLAPSSPPRLDGTPPDAGFQKGSTANGVIVHEANGRSLKIHFSRGHVTSIEEGKVDPRKGARVSITATD